MSTSAMRRGSQGKGDRFIGCQKTYSENHARIFGMNCKTCGTKMTRLADGSHICSKCAPEPKEG